MIRTTLRVLNMEESSRVHILLHYITVNRGPSLLLVGMYMYNIQNKKILKYAFIELKSNGVRGVALGPKWAPKE